MEKKLYPFKFIPVSLRKPWGGSGLIDSLGKTFLECNEEGAEVEVGRDALIGESWELADMGIVDSVVSEGWLAGNTISELMETYLERIVGENVYNYYGRQFPLLIKFLDINNKLSVQVHPDDEIAQERYDSLGKSEVWYIMDAKPGAKMYCGFSEDISAQEFYDRCKNGTVEQVLNVIYPKKGDVIHVTPGTVHAADGGLSVLEVQESSDLNFRLYDWGREAHPDEARKMHLEEAIDIIDYQAFDQTLYKKGPLWEDEHAHCGCHHHSENEVKVIDHLIQSPQFNVTKINLTDPLHIYTEQFESFIVYVCVEGHATIQVPSLDSGMTTYEVSKGETILIPAELPDFFLVPGDSSTVLIEAVTKPEEYVDQYIDPTKLAYLSDDEEDDEPSAMSPLNLFS